MDVHELLFLYYLPSISVYLIFVKIYIYKIRMYVIDNKILNM